MTITVKQQMQATTNYENFGVSVEEGLITTNVTYTIEKIDNFDGNMATGVFRVQIGETFSNERYRFMFKYSGEGNPLDQAENALEAWFKAQSNDAATEAQEE